jgi:hypothetical protein
MVVHHVYVHQIGAGGDDILHRRAEVGEIGRKYAGRYSVNHAFNMNNIKTDAGSLPVS